MRKLFGVAAAAALLVPTTADAVPVSRPAEVFLGITIQNVGSVRIGGPTIVTVDPAARSVSLAPGAIALATPTVIPVTTTTAIAQISASSISNQFGLFEPFGGAVPGEVCPPGANEACVNATYIGGIMGLTGTVKVAVIPDVVVIPVNLNAARIGQGGSTTVPFTFDAAPWTVGRGQVNTPNGTFTLSGTTNATLSRLTLVTPTFVSALGNLLPIFTTLEITLTVPTPEPGTLMLLGSGLAGLAVARRRRRQGPETAPPL